MSLENRATFESDWFIPIVLSTPMSSLGRAERVMTHEDNLKELIFLIYRNYIPGLNVSASALKYHGTGSPFVIEAKLLLDINWFCGTNMFVDAITILCRRKRLVDHR